MCLKFDQKATNDFRTKNVENDKIVVWKVIKKRGGDYYAPLRRNIIPRTGIYKSNRYYLELSEEELYFNEISLGIHVFFRKEDAEEYGMKYASAIRCHASIKDFLGTDETQEKAVFTQITILEQ